MIGVGGMAAVWLGCDVRLDRPVAVKLLSDNLASDPDYVRRFNREARTAARLSHPNLVKVYDFEPEGRPAVIMEYVEGGTLEDADRDAVDVEALASQLLGALEHIHAAGIVHRDVKPANVLIAADGRAMLTDFGIAQHEDATPADARRARCSERSPTWRRRCWRATAPRRGPTSTRAASCCETISRPRARSPCSGSSNG